MPSLFSLSDDLLRRVLDELPQRDAIALCTTSRQFNAFYPADVTRVFAPDATVDEYIAMCEWIVTRGITSFTLAVNSGSWNYASLRTLKGIRFDRVTIVPNEYSRFNVNTGIWVPECDASFIGFTNDRRLSYSSGTQTPNRWFAPHRHDGRKAISVRIRHLSTGSDFSRLPHFETVPGSEHIERIGSITCAGHVEGVDLLPLDIDDITIERAPLRQADIDHLARFEGSLCMTKCKIDASVQRRSFVSRELSVTLDAMRVISESACTLLVLELRGDEAHLDAESLPRFPNVTHVVIAGYCHDRIRAFRTAWLFPNASRQYDFSAYDPAM